MRTQLILWFLPQLVKSALKIFSVAEIRKYLAGQIDRLEKYIIDTSTPVDDLFLPALRTIEQVLQLPEDQEEPKDETL